MLHPLFTTLRYPFILVAGCAISLILAIYVARLHTWLSELIRDYRAIEHLFDELDSNLSGSME